MKRLIALAATALALGSSAHAECVKVDYQELKEFSDKELVAKYCKDKDALSLYETVISFNQSLYEAAQAIHDSSGTSKALNSMGESISKQDVCKSEVERTVRLLQQKNIDVGTAGAQCAALRPKGPFPLPSR